MAFVSLFSVTGVSSTSTRSGLCATTPVGRLGRRGNRCVMMADDPEEGGSLVVAEDEGEEIVEEEEEEEVEVEEEEEEMEYEIEAATTDPLAEEAEEEEEIEDFDYMSLAVEEKVVQPVAVPTPSAPIAPVPERKATGIQRIIEQAVSAEVETIVNPMGGFVSATPPAPVRRANKFAPQAVAYASDSTSIGSMDFFIPKAVDSESEGDVLAINELQGKQAAERKAILDKQKSALNKTAPSAAKKTAKKASSKPRKKMVMPKKDPMNGFRSIEYWNQPNQAKE